MTSFWQSDSGHLTHRWSDLSQPQKYDAPWMHESESSEGSHLDPVPNFAEHSPFGRGSWFVLHRRGGERR